MNIQAMSGKLENGDKFIKIDTRQLSGEAFVMLKLFGESVKINLDNKEIAPFARVTEWFLNGTKVISVSYHNK